MEKLIINGREIKLPKQHYRGWDAADEYLLSEITEIEGVTLVIDDISGALTCGIPGSVISYNSSICQEHLVKESLILNDKKAELVSNFDLINESVDRIVVRLPKSIDLLEYYIQIIGSNYPGATVIVCGMVKYMPISMVRLMEKYFDHVKTSLARKKARLIYGTAAMNFADGISFPVSYKTDEGLGIFSYPGVFSYDHLDIGSRFLITNLPKDLKGTVIDLGCASGALGLTAKKMNPNIEVVLTDESYLAIQSAKESFKQNGLDGTFYVMDILESIESSSADTILCNPPFHKGNAVSIDVAIKMFMESKRVLKRGGNLIVVANRHLGYHKKLRSIFHNLTRVAENGKFMIFSVRKS